MQHERTIGIARRKEDFSYYFLLCLISSRFGIDAVVAKKNITWDLHRPENKSLATNKVVLFLVTDRLGDAGAFLGLK